MINFIGFTFIFAIALVFGLLIFGFWLWSLIDCLRSDKQPVEKLIWVIVILMLNILGSIIYFALKSNNSISNNKRSGKKILKRRSDDKIIAGVCSGLADYLDIDTTIVRLVFVILTIFSVGTGFLLYLIAALIMPSDGKKSSGSGFLIVFLALIFIIIITFSAIIIFSFAGYNSIDESYKKGHVRQQIQSPQTIAQHVARDNIMMSHNYKNHSGNNLFCFTIKDSKECLNEDPYGITLSNPGCFEVRCKFDSATNDTEGFVVDTIVKHNRVVSMSFDKVPKPLAEDIETNISFVNCEDRCGDGICDEMVCMAIGCPCRETVDNCQIDCG